MEAWFNSEEYKRLGRLARYIYAEFLNEEIDKALKKKCYGCQTDHPSQTNHICLDPEPTLDPFILHLYLEAAESVNLTQVEEAFDRSRKILEWEYGSSDIHQDFSTYIKKCYGAWKATDFETLSLDFTVEPSISAAVEQALEELDFNDIYCKCDKELTSTSSEDQVVPSSPSSQVHADPELTIARDSSSDEEEFIPEEEEENYSQPAFEFLDFISPFPLTYL